MSDYRIVQSEDGTFYNLLEIDENNNQTLLASESSLEKLRQHPKAKGLRAVKEADTRGIIQPDSESEET